jgi:O-antigen/teichoic acid export membrane protein
MAVKANIVANYLGKAWIGIVNFVFIPLYIRFLGAELYGLIGVYVFLVASLAVLDMGLSTTLNRSIAQRSSSGMKERDFSNLIRTFEIGYWTVGLAIGLSIFFFAPLISDYWLNHRGIPKQVVVSALRLIAGVLVLQWPTALYAGGLMGLERQTTLNIIRSGVATIQSGGAVLVLWKVSPSIQAFFLWQLISSALQTWLLARYFAASLPPVLRCGAQFELRLLLTHWRFSAGTMGITLIGTLLMQMDKVILGKMYSLTIFGYYMLGTSVTTALSGLAYPIFAAVFPRYSRLIGEGNLSELARLYHKSCRLMSFFVVPIGVNLALYSDRILTVWVRDATVINNVAPLLSVMAIGTIGNSLMLLPFALQLGAGWTRLSFYKNLIALSWFAPLLFILVSKYGPMGAAISWMILNLSYFLYEPILMHRKILPAELYKWYFVDTGLPVLLVVAVSITTKLSLASVKGIIPVVASLILCWMGILLFTWFCSKKSI